MPAFSSEFKSTLASVEAPEAPLYLIEIHHSLLTEPVRIVGDNASVVCCGNTYHPIPFRCEPPDDYEGKSPRATLTVDNVGREMMEWIERSAGGKDSKVKMMQIMRSRPDLVEWEIMLNLYNVKATMSEVSAEMGYDNLLGRQAIMARYDPQTAPGLF